MRVVGRIVVGQAERPGAALGAPRSPDVEARQRSGGRTGSSSRSPSCNLLDRHQRASPAACAIVASSRRRPIQTLPARSAIGAWNSATSGRIAGQQHDRIVVWPNGLSTTRQSRPVCEQVGADQAAQRHEGHALLGRLQAGVDRRAGGVLHADRAGLHRRGEARRRPELAQADRRGLDVSTQPAPISRSACKPRSAARPDAGACTPRRISARVAAMATPLPSRGMASRQPSAMGRKRSSRVGDMRGSCGCVEPEYSAHVDRIGIVALDRALPVIIHSELRLRPGGKA